MGLEHIDVQSLTGLLNSLSALTDLAFALYRRNGELLITARTEDRLMTQLTSYIAGKDEHKAFIRSGIHEAVEKDDILVLKGPAHQHHLFIPLSLSSVVLILVSTPFYFNKSEFEHFILEKGHRFGLSLNNVEPWHTVITLKEYSAVRKTAEHVKVIFETVLKSSHESTLYQKQHQWNRTLTNALATIRPSQEMGDVYAMALDAIMFLFDIDTASVMIKEGEFYRNIRAAGRLKDDVTSVLLKEDRRILHAIERETVTSISNADELAALGIPDSISSLQVFPRVDFNGTRGIVVAYNTLIDQAKAQSIMEFLKLLSLALRLHSLQHTHSTYLNDLERLSAAPEKITPNLYHPDALYEMIVNTASELTKAEKASLMLPEDDGLLIKAAKGENKALTQGVKVKMGEGVAGRVFKEGEPLIANNAEMLRHLAIKPKKHYKTGSFISMPLTFDGEKIGVLNIADKATGGEFTPIDAHLLNYFASYASLALKVASCHILTEELRALSITDPLTGLFNRRYLEERFTEEIRRSERYNLSCSMVLFDIDDFKLLNDSEGHLAGDEVLKEVAKGAQRSARVHDVFCRFGGEEFAIIMPQTSMEEAYLVAERIRNNVKTLPLPKWENFPHDCVTVSLGVAAFPENGKTVEELIKNADTALYQAKSLGKDKSCMYHPSTPAK